jgi:hypothetical protein
MNSKRSIALFIGMAFLLVACVSRPAYGAPASDPCSFLTKGQVSAVLGVQVGEGQRVAPTLCQWSAPGPPEATTKKVTLTFQNAQAFAYAKMPAGHGITKTPMSGLGDDAVFGVTPKFAATIAVKKGETVFTVHVWGFPIDPGNALDRVQAMEKSLALEVLSKL